MFLIVAAEPILSVIVLRIAHDGVDVIGFLNGEFDDQPRSMHPIIEGAANVIGGTAPGKMQLLEAGASNGVEVPLGRVGEAEEFGALVAFLVSAPAAFITGVAINFDGGHSAVV